MGFPLEGVKVVDLADEPLALAARLLSDLGADVVRVESSSGDWLRQTGPFVHDEPGIERSLCHMAYNAGKRSLAVDWGRPGAAELFGRLAAQADVVIAPLRPAEWLAGLLEDVAFRAIAPSTGIVEPVFRRHARAEATDLIGLAAGGQLHLNGYLEDPPNHPAGNLAYKQLALASALAAMSMVLEKSAGRAPGRVQVSMQEAVMWTTIQSANENYWHWHKMSPGRRGIENLGGRTIFLTRDGKHLSLYHHPPAFAAFARWYGEQFGDDSFTRAPWDDDLYRIQHAEAITNITAEFCASMDRDVLIAEAQKRWILAVPVQGVAEIAADPHLRQRGFFQRVWVEQLNEEIELMRAPFVTSAYRAEAKAPPALGEHSRAVLGECGYSSAEIESLVAGGLVSARAQAVSA